MSDRKKMWVFSELFFPEETSTAYILTQISRTFSKKYDVEVVCTYPAYDNTSVGEKLDTKLKDIKITRIKSFKGNKNNNLVRILKFIYLSLGFAYYFAFKTKKGDNVFLVTNPAPFLIFAALLKPVKKVKLNILVHDVFPENTVPAKYMRPGSVFYQILKWLFEKAYTNYDTIVVLGRDMQTLFQKKLQKSYKKPVIAVIENWADTRNIFPKANDSFTKKKVVLQFAGNLGAIQGLDSLFAVIAEVKNDLLEFHFIGTGKLKARLQNFTNEKSLGNVIFKPPFKRGMQNETLNECSIGLVSLAEGMTGLGVPSKTYNILAAGKPILFIGDSASEISMLIKEHNVGWAFDFQERIALIDFLNSLNPEKIANDILEKGSKARSLAEGYYSEEVILEKYLDLI